MIGPLAEAILKILGDAHTKQKLRKQQKEGIDRSKFAIRGVEGKSYPVMDQLYGLERALVNYNDCKPEDTIPHVYISSFLQKADIYQEGNRIIAAKGSIELNFEIEGRRVMPKYELIKPQNPEEDIPGLEVRYHHFDLVYIGWNLPTNHIVGPDQHLKKPGAKFFEVHDSQRSYLF